MSDKESASSWSQVSYLFRLEQALDLCDDRGDGRGRLEDPKVREGVSIPLDKVDHAQVDPYVGPMVLPVEGLGGPGLEARVDLLAGPVDLHPIGKVAAREGAGVRVERGGGR